MAPKMQKSNYPEIRRIFRTAYFPHNLTTSEIAVHRGVSRQTVHYTIKKLGLEEEYQEAMLRRKEKIAENKAEELQLKLLQEQEDKIPIVPEETPENLFAHQKAVEYMLQRSHPNRGLDYETLYRFFEAYTHENPTVQSVAEYSGTCFTKVNDKLRRVRLKVLNGDKKRIRRSQRQMEFLEHVISGSRMPDACLAYFLPGETRTGISQVRRRINETVPHQNSLEAFGKGVSYSIVSRVLERHFYGEDAEDIVLEEPLPSNVRLDAIETILEEGDSLADEVIGEIKFLYPDFEIPNPWLPLEAAREYAQRVERPIY